MKRLLAVFLLFTVALLLPSRTRAQDTIAFSAANIIGLNGALLTSGSICLQATDQNNNIISFQQAGSGSVVTTPYCTAVTNGGITTFNVANPANTSPVNIRYWIVIKQGARTVLNSPGAYLCNQSGACTSPYTFDFDNCFSSGACIANPNPIVSGPQGAPGYSLPCSYQGTYSSGTTYSVTQCVIYSNQYYISLVNSNTGNTPSSSPTDWTALTGASSNISSGTVGDIGQYNGTTSIGPGVLASSLASNTLANNFAADQSFCGPAPYFDITCKAFGARAQAIGAPWNSTGNCNSNTTFNVTGATPASVTGDGVYIVGCGATATLTAPVPTVTSGISNTLTQQDAVLTTLSTGSTDYYYTTIAMDKNGGLSAASSPVEITNGPSSLGMQSLAVTSASLSGRVLTLTLPATNSLAQGELIHFRNPSNDDLTGWGTIASVSGGGETIVLANLNVQTNTSSAITSTGGYIYFAVANQLNWMAGTEWMDAVCSSTDGVNYTWIGFAYPNSSAGYFSSARFTDYGPTMTTAPTIATPYITNSICLGAGKNDDLSTTISSGGGGTTLTLANAASQTVSGAAIYYDDVPAIKAAFAATSGAFYPVVRIPAPGGSKVFHTYAFLDLSSYGPTVAIEQSGTVYWGNTVEYRGKWTGISAGSEDNFQETSNIVSNCKAWPCLYEPAEVPNWSYLSLNATGNAANVVMIDGEVSIQGGYFHNINVSTGEGSGDYTGTCFVVRPGPFGFTFFDDDCATGPGNTSASFDTTWTDAFYFSDSGNTPYSVIGYNIMSERGSARGTLYDLTYGGPAQARIDDFRIQGNILPMYTMQSTTYPSQQRSGIVLTADKWLPDTTSMPSLAFLGDTNVQMFVSNFAGLSSGGHGAPPWVSGDELSGTAIQYARLEADPALPTGMSVVNSADSNAIMPQLTQPVIASGFGTSPALTAMNGATSFEITVGSGGVASTGVITLATAPHGWSCSLTDLTTQSTSVAQTAQTGSSTTSATFTQYSDIKVATAWAAADVLVGGCLPF